MKSIARFCRNALGLIRIVWIIFFIVLIVASLVLTSFFVLLGFGYAIWRNFLEDALGIEHRVRAPEEFHLAP